MKQRVDEWGLIGVFAAVTNSVNVFLCMHGYLFQYTNKISRVSRISCDWQSYPSCAINNVADYEVFNE